MKTTWRVTKRTETEGLAVVELVRVEWFKKNPAWLAMDARYDELLAEHDNDTEAVDPLINAEFPDFIDEFIDASPGEEGAQFTEASGHLTLDLSDGMLDANDALDLRPGDDVIVDLAHAAVFAT